MKGRVKQGEQGSELCFRVISVKRSMMDISTNFIITNVGAAKVTPPETNMLSSPRRAGSSNCFTLPPTPEKSEAYIEVGNGQKEREEKTEVEKPDSDEVENLDCDEVENLDLESDEVEKLDSGEVERLFSDEVMILSEASN